MGGGLAHSRWATNVEGPGCPKDEGWGMTYLLLWLRWHRVWKAIGPEKGEFD